MTKYEYLMEKKQYCEDFAAATDDSRLAKFHAEAAKGFYSRAMSLTLAEAAEPAQGEGRQ